MYNSVVLGTVTLLCMDTEDLGIKHTSTAFTQQGGAPSPGLEKEPWGVS